jgi:hypothetical protein
VEPSGIRTSIHRRKGPTVERPEELTPALEGVKADRVEIVVADGVPFSTVAELATTVEHIVPGPQFLRLSPQWKGSLEEAVGPIAPLRRR